MKAYNINIIGLSHQTHCFDYQFGNEFFEHFGTEIVSGGKFNAELIVIKQETLIEIEFKVKGEANLICDRSLEPFSQNMNITKKVLFKYGEEETELSDEINIISRDRAVLNVGQYLYEFIVLALPMKRIHPNFRDDDQSNEGKMIYTTPSDKPEEKSIDPRWEQLKKLK